MVWPATGEMVYKSEEQWHWFDCPRQLGTNSSDTPAGCAVVDEVVIREGDAVLAMSDGVIDNLWTHEIVCVCGRWSGGGRMGRGWMRWGMWFVAEELKERRRGRLRLIRLRRVRLRSMRIEEGLASEGGECSGWWVGRGLTDMMTCRDADDISGGGVGKKNE